MTNLNKLTVAVGIFIVVGVVVGLDNKMGPLFPNYVYCMSCTGVRP